MDQLDSHTCHYSDVTQTVKVADDAVLQSF